MNIFSKILVIAFVAAFCAVVAAFTYRTITDDAAASVGVTVHPDRSVSVVWFVGTE